jgi:hypothetical protein
LTVDIGREIGPVVPAPRIAAHQPTLEPLDGLQWSRALEFPRDAGSATQPEGIRRAWIHRAPEAEVLALFRSVSTSGEPIPAPWWLRALAEGTLDSRATGFRVEDRMAQLLSRRPGWEYVPWVADGESGYWEFMPSERGRSGHPIPTTILNTSRHRGWIDVLPAHGGTTPEPIAVAGLAGLRSRLGEFEAVR